MYQTFARDLSTLMYSINAHPQKWDMIRVLKKGPDPKRGWMLCTPEDPYWTAQESVVLSMLTNMVLEHHYESWGFVFMMRALEKEVHKKYSVYTGMRESTLP